METFVDYMYFLPFLFPLLVTTVINPADASHVCSANTVSSENSTPTFAGIILKDLQLCSLSLS